MQLSAVTIAFALARARAQGDDDASPPPPPPAPLEPAPPPSAESGAPPSGVRPSDPAPSSPPVSLDAPSRRRRSHLVMAAGGAWHRIYDVDVRGGDLSFAYRDTTLDGNGLLGGVTVTYARSEANNPVVVVTGRGGLDLRPHERIGIGFDARLNLLQYVRATTKRPIGAFGLGIELSGLVDVARFGPDDADALFLGLSGFGDVYEFEGGDPPPLVLGGRAFLGVRWSVGGSK